MKWERWWGRRQFGEMSAVKGGVSFWLFRVREDIGAKETKTLSQGDQRKARAECEPGGRNKILSKTTWARGVGERPAQSSEHRGAGPQELGGWARARLD